MPVVSLILLGVTVIAAIVAVVLRRKASDLDNKAEINLIGNNGTEVALHLNNDVVVEGIAAGVPIESPWSKRQGLAFEAVRVHERRDHDGKTSTRSDHLGTHMQEMYVVGGPQGPAALVNRTSRLSILNFPKVSIANNMLGDLLGQTRIGVSLGGVNLGGGGDRVEEAAVVPGDKVWVVGRLEHAPSGGFVITGDEIVLSGKSSDDMEASYKTKALVGFAISGAALIAAVVVFLAF